MAIWGGGERERLKLSLESTADPARVTGKSPSHNTTSSRWLYVSSGLRRSSTARCSPSGKSWRHPYVLSCLSNQTWYESLSRFKHVFGLNSQGKAGDIPTFYIPGNHDVGYSRVASHKLDGILKRNWHQMFRSLYITYHLIKPHAALTVHHLSLISGFGAIFKIKKGNAVMRSAARKNEIEIVMDSNIVGAGVSDPLMRSASKSRTRLVIQRVIRTIMMSIVIAAFNVPIY
ncbi:hypothetical protein Bca4012_064793 [Brassica carinata]